MRDSVAREPAPIPWRRVARLLKPIRGGVAGMVSLTIGGVLVGLVPPLALGALINALVERGDIARGGAACRSGRARGDARGRRLRCIRQPLRA